MIACRVASRKHGAGHAWRPGWAAALLHGLLPFAFLASLFFPILPSAVTSSTYRLSHLAAHQRATTRRASRRKERPRYHHSSPLRTVCSAARPLMRCSQGKKGSTLGTDKKAIELAMPCSTSIVWHPRRIVVTRSYNPPRLSLPDSRPNHHACCGEDIQYIRGRCQQK